MPRHNAQERAAISALSNIHPETQCSSDRECIIHRPTEHHMRDWVLYWREDRGIFERICPCGIGHPDPNQFGFWKETNQSWQAVHGCCGCCQEPKS